MIERFVRLILAAGLAVASSAAHAIVGGTDETGALSRSSVMVLSSNGGVCSAVVIAPDAVLTAAHCVTGADQHRVHFREQAGEPVLIVPTDKSVHPGYDAKAIEKRTRSIDLALVRLPEPLSARFESAALGSAKPSKDDAVTVSGYGLSRAGDAKTTGTFRAVAMKAIEPYGPSQILLWLRGQGKAGACQGDSGGPVAMGGAVVAITTWSESCGGLTQAILLGAQRAWIDRVLQGWQRQARWSGN